jgi:hypothetical protein
MNRDALDEGDDWDNWVRPSHGAHQTKEQLAQQPVPFPSTTAAAPVESGCVDWRDRLTRNFARRSDGGWEPLTWVHADTDQSP